MGGTLPFNMLAVAVLEYSALFFNLLARILDVIGDEVRWGGVATFFAGVVSGAGDLGMEGLAVGNPAGRSEEFE